jgi:hypothetical protein
MSVALTGAAAVCVTNWSANASVAAVPTKQPNVVTCNADAWRSAGFWPTTAPAARLRKPDDHRPGERHGQPGQQAARKALPQQPATQQRDDHRADVDHHRGRARVHVTLAPVERHHVHAEPENPGAGDAGPGGARRPALAPGQPDHPENNGAGQQPAQSQRARVEVPPCVTYRHEGRRPRQHRDRHRGQRPGPPAIAHGADTRRGTVQPRTKCCGGGPSRAATAPPAQP